ncbi:hypothetical protein HDK90DRAFT_344967 [Phyllosticta capitalensis]|uniref:Uncharacterized protein n=1 Tax=Phyllosticta capitalensis TaxID=121624 RepID=A0ABR1YH03_9PEZI
MTHRSLDLAQAHVHATLPTCRYIQKHPLPHAPHHRSRITKLPSSPVPADPKIPHVPPSGPLQPAHRHLSSALLPTTTLISSYTLLCLYLEVLLKINLPLQNQLRHPNHQHSPNNNQTKTRHGTHPQILCRHRPAPLHDALRAITAGVVLPFVHPYLQSRQAKRDGSYMTKPRIAFTPSPKF